LCPALPTKIGKESKMLIFVAISISVSMFVWFILKRDLMLRDIKNLENSIAAVSKLVIDKNCITINEIKRLDNKYKHLLCEHDFSSPEKADGGVSLVCKHCGMRNPNYRWFCEPKGWITYNLEGFKYGYKDENGDKWHYKEKHGSIALKQPSGKIMFSDFKLDEKLLEPTCFSYSLDPIRKEDEMDICIKFKGVIRKE
jgi:hypothetical protein